MKRGGPKGALDKKEYTKVPDLNFTNMKLVMEEKSTQSNQDLS